MACLAVQDDGRPTRCVDRPSYGLLVRQPRRFLTSSVACGSTVNRSPTTPKSTSSKIGASGSLLIATIVLDVCMPARCWIAPEIPLATYSCGDTCLPVWPTWLLCGYQPASTAAREAPTAAPTASANASTGPKSPFVPRPPETTIAASDRSGRPLFSLGRRSTIFADLARSETVTGTAITSGVAGPPETGSGAAELGFTVITGTPVVTDARTENPAAKTDWVVTGPEGPASTSTASV